MGKKVKSLEHLKKLAANKNGQRQDFYIAIIEGIARSIKQILYDRATQTFTIVHENDYSIQENLTDIELKEKTHIVDAIETGHFYKY
jgi:hypothetical protein